MRTSWWRRARVPPRAGRPLERAAARVSPPATSGRVLEGRSMQSERQKMLAGEMYDPLDPELVIARERARDLCQALNATREGEHDERRRILRQLFATGGDTVW